MHLLSVVLAGVPVGECTDPRRCIVVGIQEPSHWILVPCSAQLDLHRPRVDFLIPEDHADFAATGFQRTSYAIEGPLVRVRKEQVRKVYGRLEGELADAFKAWMGLE